MKNQIQNYLIGKTLGQGTFGKVKYGTHISTNEPVAIKILDKSIIEQQNDVERVNREIAILRKVRHPNIIQLYEIIETNEKIYLIMEYASGGELFQFIVKQKRVSEQQCSKFLQQIISAVQYFHKLGIVHRDLKPENMLFDKNLNIKIADFGLSNIYSPGSLLVTPCGSPCYAAPEMIQGKKYDGIYFLNSGLLADIWSCGIIIFACLCGFLPFDHKEIQYLYQKIISGEYINPSHLSREAKILIKGLLTTDPLKRYNINDIRKSEYYLKNVTSPEPKGVIVGVDQIYIEESALDIIFGQTQTKERDELKKQVLENKHNQFTTQYYLLLQKMGERITQIREKRSFSNNLEKEQMRNKRSFSNANDQVKETTVQPKVAVLKSNFLLGKQEVSKKFSAISPDNNKNYKQLDQNQQNEKQQNFINENFQQIKTHRRNQSEGVTNFDIIEKKLLQYQQNQENLKLYKNKQNLILKQIQILKSQSPQENIKERKRLISADLDNMQIVSPSIKQIGQIQIQSPNNFPSEQQINQSKVLRYQQTKSLHQTVKQHQIPVQQHVMNKHEKFVNLNCVIGKSSILILKSLISIGEMLLLQPKILGKYTVEFQKKSLIFQAELKSLGKMIYLHFVKKQGQQDIFTEETLQLIKLVKF